jgi:L-fuconolactonase
VDAQVHPWSRGDSTGHHRRTPIDNAAMVLEMQQAAVDKVVLVPPLWDPDGNTYALSMARNAPDQFSVMGLLDPASPDACGQLQRWHTDPCMRGVRFLLNTPERLQPLHDGLYDPLWPIAQEQGSPWPSSPRGTCQ